MLLGVSLTFKNKTPPFDDYPALAFMAVKWNTFKAADRQLMLE